MISLEIFAIKNGDGLFLKSFVLETYGQNQTVNWAEFSQCQTESLLMVREDARRLLIELQICGLQMVQVGRLVPAA